MFHFVATFMTLILFVVGTLLIMWLLAKAQQLRSRPHVFTRQITYGRTEDSIYFYAEEIVGSPYGTRIVLIYMFPHKRCIEVHDSEHQILRIIDLKEDKKVWIRTASDKLRNLLSVLFQNEIDLVLRFQDSNVRDEFVFRIREFVEKFKVQSSIHGSLTEKMILKIAKTLNDRNKELELFLKAVSSEVFEKAPGKPKSRNLSKERFTYVQSINLTRTEFADALGMKPNSDFINNMFLIVDRDHNGSISFKEYLDFFIVLAKGNAMDKAELMFKMYDIDANGFLTREEFTNMIKSLVELSDSTINGAELDLYINKLFRNSRLPDQQQMTMGIFKGIFASPEFYSTFNKASLPLNGNIADEEDSEVSDVQLRQTLFRSFSAESNPFRHTRSERLSSFSLAADEPSDGPAHPTLFGLCRYMENKILYIFWNVLYILFVLGIFTDKVYHYYVEAEHKGLRRFSGLGIPISRGAASVLMFNYACLILLMCKNSITYLRSTFLYYCIPFDNIQNIHRNIALLALVFTVIHVISNAFNFYCICTQPPEDLLCIFPEYNMPSHVLPKFHYWIFGNITGVTGIVLVLLLTIIYTFSLAHARTHAYKVFWMTHKLYIPVYMTLVLHGSGKLVEMPSWHGFIIGPLLVFLIDKLVSINRRTIEITIDTIEVLPSNVLKLVVKRPHSFEFMSGQWARLACDALGRNEFHPFTITSAPHENFLSFHIRTVGPWTSNLRDVLDPNKTRIPHTKLYIDGPYGQGNQEWYRYPISVLVGGGIGVTPFASILKDITYKLRMRVSIPCKKVYFLWVTRTQKQFEWMSDMIKDIENELHGRKMVDIHIFITQFKQKYDLRTTMLYICERHFQRLAGKSLMTGLQAVTHFGRPNFKMFLKLLHFENSNVDKIGIFSSGPLPMKTAVEQACTELNILSGFPIYFHQFEKF